MPFTGDFGGKLTKTAVKCPALPGENVQYQIRLHDTQGSDPCLIKIVDALPKPYLQSTRTPSW